MFYLYKAGAGWLITTRLITLKQNPNIQLLYVATGRASVLVELEKLLITTIID